MAEKKINQELTNYLNDGLVPKFKESAHKYFEENFLEGFSWKKIYPNKIKKIKEFQNLKYYVNNSDFSAGYIDENGNLELDGGLFQEKKITGMGVFTFFHEISHCWLNYKFKGELDIFRKSGNRIQYNIIEGFCDFISCDIIKKTKIKHLFPDSLKYADELKNAYAYLGNIIKYATSPESYFTNEEIFKKERKKFTINNLFPDYNNSDEDRLYLFNYPVRAKIFGILSCYDTLKQRKKFLINPPITMQELNNYIPKISK